MSYTSSRRTPRLRGRDYGQPATYFVTVCTTNRAHFFGTVRNRQMWLSPFGQFAHDCWLDLPRRWPHLTLGAFQVMPNHVHGVLTIGWPVGARLTVAAGELNTNSAPTRAATRAAPTGQILQNLGLTRGDALLGTEPLFTQPTEPEGPAGAALVAAQQKVWRHNQSEDRFFPSTYFETSVTEEIEGLPFTKIQWATRPSLLQAVGAYKSVVANACLQWHRQQQPAVWLPQIWQRGYHDTPIYNSWVLKNVTHYICHNPHNWSTDILNTD